MMLVVFDMTGRVKRCLSSRGALNPFHTVLEKIRMLTLPDKVLFLRTTVEVDMVCDWLSVT